MTDKQRTDKLRGVDRRDLEDRWDVWPPALRFREI